MEDVLLGYNPSAVLSNCPSRNSCDVDFSDVFGGPPRRSSTSFDSHSVDGNHEVADEGCSSWIMTREKPVFGEASAGVRRRYTSDDFFDDIFRGDQQTLGSSQSPRVVRRRSPFSSAPGSRVMSPSRSLPPSEPFAIPAKFSLPSSATTNTDFTASTSMNQSSFSPSLSRFNQPFQNHDGSYHSSSQSNAFPPCDSTDLKESTSGSQTDGFAKQSDIHDTVKISDFPIYASNFHFSIYKWASKGVPLLVSFRKKSPGSKQETKLNRFGSEEGVEVDKLFSENHMVDIPVSEVLPSEETMRAAPTLNERQQKNDSFGPTTTTAKAKSKGDDNALAEPRPYGTSPSNVVDKTRKEVSSRGLEDTSNDPLKQLPKKSSNTRPLSSFLNANDEGNETLSTQNTRDKMRKVKEKEKSPPIDDFSSHKVHKTEAHKSSSPAKEKDYRNSEATAKVKDFVKIFNQESSSKASGPSLRQSHSRRWKDTKTIDVDYEIRFSSARIMDDEMEASYVNWGEAWPDTSEMEDETSTGSHRFNMNDAGCVPETAGQTSANVTTASLRDSAPINNAGSEDDLQSYETKVSKWSKGKEGNIRALLSTLQYVLWPESGWKPIPLADIIEANAVKRAYQRALLRLHPDKLQQKGAGSHHKFIAEKVFDILQDAWDQFGSTGSL